jgi:quinol monooxygenase YgiN
MKRGYLPLLAFITAIGTLGAFKLVLAAAPIGIITIVSHVDIVPDRTTSQAQEKAAALFREEMTATQKDKGLVSYVVLKLVGPQNHFTIVETWADSDAYAAHVASEHTIEFRKNIQPYLASPFDARVHQVFR